MILQCERCDKALTGGYCEITTMDESWLRLCFDCARDEIQVRRLTCNEGNLTSQPDGG